MASPRQHIRALPPDEARAWDEAERAQREAKLLQSLAELHGGGGGRQRHDGEREGQVAHSVTYESSSTSSFDDDDNDEDGEEDLGEECQGGFFEDAFSLSFIGGSPSSLDGDGDDGGAAKVTDGAEGKSRSESEGPQQPAAAVPPPPPPKPKPSIFLGSLPPPPTQLNISYGSSIVTDLRSVGHELEDGQEPESEPEPNQPKVSNTANSVQQQRMARSGVGLRAPPVRVTPASRHLDTSSSFQSRGGGGGDDDDQSSAAGTTRSEAESLPWRRALADGPDAAAAAAVAACRTNSDGGAANQRQTPTAASTFVPPFTITSPAVRGANTSANATADGHDSLANVQIRSLEIRLNHAMAQNRALYNRAGRDGRRMEQMAVSEAEAREELELLRAQWRDAVGRRGGHSAADDDDGPTLAELRGSILQRTREDLAIASETAVQLRSALDDVSVTAVATHDSVTAENAALRDEVRKLSSQLAQRAVRGSDRHAAAARRIEALNATARRTEEHLAEKAAAAEATAGELRRQLDEARETSEKEAQRASRAERERDKLSEELGAATESLAEVQAEVRDVRRDRDGLRGELTELLRARENPERAMEREFGAEIDRLRRVADGAKADAERRVEEVERLDEGRREELARARRGELDATEEAGRLRVGMRALVEQLWSLDRAGELGPVGAKKILAASLGSGDSSVNDALYGALSRQRSPTDGKKDGSEDVEVVDHSGQQRDRTVHVSSASAQTETHGSERDALPPQPSTEAIGINTDVTATYATNLYVEGLQTRSDLHSAELRITQLQTENANLRGKCEHVEGQLLRCEKRLESMESAASQASEGTAEEFKRLSSVCDDLKTTNARLNQEKLLLAEAKLFVEEENRRVVERTVALERLAEEATAECERLSMELATTKKDIEDVRKKSLEPSEKLRELEQDKVRLVAESKEAKEECERLRSEVDCLTKNTETLQVQRDEIRIETERLSLDKSKLEADAVELMERLSEAEKSALSLQEEKTGLAEIIAETKEKCLRLEDENHATKNKLEFYESDLVARNEKYDDVITEKLGLEGKVNDCRNKMAQMSNEQIQVEAERSRLQEENASIKGELKTYAAEWRVIKEKFDTLLEEKENLEQQLENLRTETEAAANARSQDDIERDKLRTENETMKENIDACEAQIRDMTDRLNHTVCEKLEIERRLLSSERELHDLCVQAKTLIRSPEARAIGIQTLGGSEKQASPLAGRDVDVGSGSTEVRDSGTGEGFITVENCSQMTSHPSTPVQQAQTGESNDVSTIKSILADIQSSLATSQADKEETLLKTRLSAEKEIQTLRISLDTAEEHIQQLKGQMPEGEAEMKTANTSNSFEESFEERLLRIKEATEQASLAAAYQQRLADLTSPEKRVILKSDQTKGLLDNYKKRTEGRKALKKSIAELHEIHDAEKRALHVQYRQKSSALSLAEKAQVVHFQSPSQYKTPVTTSMAAVGTPTMAEHTQQSDLRSTSSHTPSSTSRSRESFRETEAFVLSILNSCGRR